MMLDLDDTNLLGKLSALCCVQLGDTEPEKIPQAIRAARKIAKEKFLKLTDDEIHLIWEILESNQRDRELDRLFDGLDAMHREVLRRCGSGGTSLIERLMAICGWHYSGPQQPRSQRAALKVVRGQELKHPDRLLLIDALAAFPDRDEELDKLLNDLRRNDNSSIQSVALRDHREVGDEVAGNGLLR